jgi:hypothetical protein
VKEDELKAEAAQVIGVDEEIIAAGIFGLQDDYAKIAVAGVATGAVESALHLDSPAAAGLGGVVAIEASRQVHAKEEGVRVRMLVAVTPSRIHVLDRSTTGSTQRELMSFDRADTAVQITKFGLSRHLNLAQGEQRLGLTGSVAAFSAEAGGDKLVLQLLADPS